MIGIFDSGFGGLGILRAIAGALPKYDYLYLGDSGHAPYGSRTQAEIYELTKKGVEYLFSQGAKLVIVACNTASSEALRMLQADYAGTDKKVLGVLVPFAEAAAATHNKHVGVMATEATVRSDAYAREVGKLDPDIAISQVACPELVPLIETGKTDTPELRALVRGYVQPLRAAGIDTLVLGCTHYGLIEPLIREAAGEGMRIILERDVMPAGLSAYLMRHSEIESTLGQGGTRQFFTTGDITHFNEHGSVFFGAKVQASHAAL